MKVLLAVTLFCFFALSISSVAHAEQERKFYVDVQSGSMMGSIHTSFGIAVKDRHNFLFGVGYVPEMHDHEEMGLLSFRYRFDSAIVWDLPEFAGMRWQLRPINIGLGVLHSLHHDLAFHSPSNTPDGYYGPQDTRLTFNYQAVVRFNSNVEAYIDFSMIEMGISGYVKEFTFYKDNYDFLGLEGVVNWGVGMRYRFN